MTRLFAAKGTISLHVQRLLASDRILLYDLARMPSTSLIVPASDVDLRTGATHRRAASRKQASSVTRSSVPLITRSAYQRVVQGDGSQVTDKKMLSLASARAKLGEALLMLDAAIHRHNPQLEKNLTPDDQAAKAPTYNRLRSIRDAVEKQVLAFPLEVRD